MKERGRNKIRAWCQAALYGKKQIEPSSVVPSFPVGGSPYWSLPGLSVYHCSGHGLPCTQEAWWTMDEDGRNGRGLRSSVKDYNDDWNGNMDPDAYRLTCIYIYAYCLTYVHACWRTISAYLQIIGVIVEQFSRLHEVLIPSTLTQLVTLAATWHLPQQDKNLPVRSENRYRIKVSSSLRVLGKSTRVNAGTFSSQTSTNILILWVTSARPCMISDTFELPLLACRCWDGTETGARSFKSIRIIKQKCRLAIQFSSA